jgi:hypothetical protein
VIATYAAVLAVCLASLAIGQAALALCGARGWSWLSPAVGLALVCAICWGTGRLPGEGVAAALAVLVVCVAASLFLWRRSDPVRRSSADRSEADDGRFPDDGWALPEGLAVGLPALAVASLPFLVAGHFGILGTSFNPDMSQHLLAADRLAAGTGSQLLHQGYPMGPHAVVVALNGGLGVGLVQGFSGLTVAVAVLAALTALTAFRNQALPLRIGGALLVGLPYMAASYVAQGAFKETMQALFVLAFVLALREASRNPAWRELPLRFVPAALIAVGSVYTYSFPGLVWLFGATVIWIAIEGARGARPATWRPGLLAGLVFAVLIAPEVGRMLDFHSFETFDPNGPGLGNLFGQVSPFEALGIWPSGDFRLSPGDGAVPAFGYYLGAAFASILLLYGAFLCWRRRESAILSGLLAAVAVFAATRLGGTPYTAAKAIEVAAPLAVLVIVLPLLRRPVGMLFFLAAAACSLLAFANAPVGPRGYSPALTEMRPLLGTDPTLVLADPALLSEEHGTPYIAWELRGGRICIESKDESRAGGDQTAGGGDEAAPERAGAAFESGRRPPAGVRFVITEGASVPPFAGLRLRRAADPYELWQVKGPVRGKSNCPLIAVRQARAGSPR